MAEKKGNENIEQKKIEQKKEQKTKKENKKLDISGGKFGGKNNNTIWIFVAVAVGFIILQFVSMQDSVKKIDEIRFETKMLLKKDVEKVKQA